MKQLTDRDKAENLWQMLNTVVMLTRIGKKIDDKVLGDIYSCLSINRPNSEETQIQQNKDFAKKVLDELPLYSEVPLVNRIQVMCKNELGIDY